jgi:hypothetical protein
MFIGGILYLTPMQLLCFLYDRNGIGLGLETINKYHFRFGDCLKTSIHGTICLSPWVFWSLSNCFRAGVDYCHNWYAFLQSHPNPRMAILPGIEEWDFDTYE